jgi:hypothetical protein
VAVTGRLGLDAEGYGVRGWLGCDSRSHCSTGDGSVWSQAVGPRFIALWVLLGMVVYAGLIVGGMWITNTPPIG